jgi:hypothetical protein
MGATGHLAVSAAAKTRNGGRPCAAVLGEPLPALDDAGLLVHPSADFAARALVSSAQQVIIDRFVILSPSAYGMGGARSTACAFAPRGVCVRVCGWS